ncbi:MAG TPA: transcriptional initiation protein Tat [Rhodopila sp.]|nr:transcriptional initiation protein Tat [Rhodopila sp.]
MPVDPGRRDAFRGLTSVAIGVATLATASAHAETAAPQPAQALAELTQRLHVLPRRRDFKTVPMILDHADLWDDAALRTVIAYGSSHKQVWDHIEIAGPWLNLMRNAINAQVFSFGHADFLAVSATHGTAHLALFDQPTWDKYKLAALAGGRFASNTLIVPKPASSADFEDPASVYGPAGNTIPALQARGVVFLACHNAIWELAGNLLAHDVNPDKLSHPALAAELTNHLIPGAVLTPGMVATIPELQQQGFHYVA